LVMYEMFTGRAPFEANTAAEMLRVRQTSRATNPSTLVHDMDPAVERAIMRCLDPDPKMRPQTALAVAAALPGGDPLAAALAAGETPSPEVVAAAGTNEGLRPMIAIGVVAGILALIAVLLTFVPRSRMVNKVPLENPPEVLAAKAREIARKLGYPDKPADTAYGLDFSGYDNYLEGKVHGMAEWDKALSKQPSTLELWYRQSPRPMVAISISSNGIVTRQDPPMRVSGMVFVNVDPDGRLTQFQAIPPQLDTTGNSARSADWGALFSAADLDISKFQTTAPQWVPVVDTDSSAAWTGTYPDHPDLPIRVEAAAWHGKPVYFDIIWPWTKPTRLTEVEGSLRDKIGYYLKTFLILGIIIVAIVMARQNVVAGRGDDRGAVRLGVFGGVTVLIGWVISAHHVAVAGSEQLLITEAVASALARGVMLWGVYMALEPWVRRHWPQTLITWTRLLSGRFRDPLVGRDLMFSVLFGLAYCALIVAFESLDRQPSGDFHLSNLLGGKMITYGMIQHILGGLVTGPEFLFMLFLLRVLLRKQWLAAIAFVLIWSVMQASQGGGSFIIKTFFFMVIFGLIVTILLRFGLFAIVVTVMLIDWINDSLLTVDFSAWYSMSTVFVLLTLGAMTAFGFWTSLGSRKLLDEQSLEA
jgi:hypothetical protein